MTGGDDELKRPMRLAGLDKDSYVMALVNSPILPRDKKAKLAKFLSGHAARHSPIPHPFLPGPTTEEAEAATTELGSVVTGNGPEYPFRFREEHLVAHTQIDPPTGGGKTMLLLNLSRQARRTGKEQRR